MLATRARMAAAGASAGGGSNWYDGLSAAWQPKGAGSLAASYVDLTGNGNTITAGTAPSLVANGWSFTAASSQYLITPVTPSSHEFTLWVQIASIANSHLPSQGALGAYGPGANEFVAVWPDLSGTKTRWQNGFSYEPGSFTLPALTPGNYCISYDRLFHNASLLYTYTGGFGTVLTRPLWIGGINNNGVLAVPLNGVIAAVGFAQSSYLTANAQAVATAMMAL